MVEVFDAVKLDVAETRKLHRGTREYLESIRASLIEKSRHEVPDHHVTAEGRYDPGNDASRRSTGG